jgi:prepilin-type N-terminal cleavage/methylation domain-containing protein
MRGSQGFTLIELLGVVAIIGILAAIAIPQFAEYRTQSFCASVQADVKNTVLAEERYFATYQVYGADEIITKHGTVPNEIDSTMNVAIKTAHGNDINEILPGMNVGSTGNVVGKSANCIRPDGKKTFTFAQATGQYTWD